jgi:small-conductance mechanosensitive channel
MPVKDLAERFPLEKAALDLHLFTIAGTPVTVATLVVFVAIVAVAYVLSKLMQRALSRALSRRKIRDDGTIAVTNQLLHYSALIIGLAVGLHTIGINLTGLFAAGALFAVGLGFAFQSLAQNFVSGVILLVERSVTPGDVVCIDGLVVRVKELGIRSAIARSVNDEDLVIPNSLLVQGIVTNYTLRDSLIRVRTKVGVSYQSDMDRLFDTLQTAARDLPNRAPAKDPVVQLIEFADSSVVFETSIWIEDPWELQPQRGALNRAIWNALKVADITIAFPQLDLHLDEPVAKALAGAA